MSDSNQFQPVQINPTPEEFYKFLENEIGYERARKQEIFAWASSLLVAITGGVIALTAINKVALAPAYKWALTAAILILVLYSGAWVELHWGSYFRARKSLAAYYDKIGRAGRDRNWKHDYTTLLALLALLLVAITAVWANVPSAPTRQSEPCCCVSDKPNDSGMMKTH